MTDLERLRLTIIEKQQKTCFKEINRHYKDMGFIVRRLSEDVKWRVEIGADIAIYDDKIQEIEIVVRNNKDELAEIKNMLSKQEIVLKEMILALEKNLNDFRKSIYSDTNLTIVKNRL